MSNVIHPTAIVGPNVKLGKNNYIGPYCVLSRKTILGDDNVLMSHVSVGAPAQHRKFEQTAKTNFDEIGDLVIGSRNVFREFVTIHQPYISKTRVGSDCFVMAYAHISHDTIIEDHVTISNSAQIGGHCVLMSYVTLGLSAVLHQFSVIGSYSMLGMGAVTKRHLIPFSKFVGSPSCKRVGINTVGLERAGCTPEELHAVDEWGESLTTSL